MTLFALRARARPMLVLLVAFAVMGCREELCIKTVVAACRCQDPFMPNLESCQASAEVVSCDPKATVNPCLVNPCCRLAPTDDGGARDAAAADLGVVDGGGAGG